MHIIIGNPEIDTGWIDIDTDTGIVTYHPGNRGGGTSAYEDFKRAVQILRHAAGIKDPEFQKRTIQAASAFFSGQQVVSEILAPSGNIIAIF